MTTARPLSMSVVIPARNEEGNLKACVETVIGALTGVIADYEIIIVNDGSTDGTAALAERIAAEVAGVRVIHNARSEGFAGAYRRAMQAATKAYVAIVPGDNEMRPDSVRTIFEAVGTADIIVPVTANQEDRPRLRRVLSRTFTGSVNLLFSLRFGYFQGPSIYPTELVRSLPRPSSGFVFLTEMLVRSVSAGYEAVQVPMFIQPRRFGASSSLSFANVVAALRTVGRLFWEIRILRRPLR